jgi:hypothetical protein
MAKEQLHCLKGLRSPVNQRNLVRWITPIRLDDSAYGTHTVGGPNDRFEPYRMTYNKSIRLRDVTQAP